ncbi:hypothetical protein [Pseudoalteromonas sp. MQS005]|uniref:hypothetical protein n=1 Tax=Pseudoalteromonas sp. MQS005 TaxID=1854052 RepID=UPI0007E5113E|nr:hypothetical protein [Pseudoalteromonas sp. MQS005]
MTTSFLSQSQQVALQQALFNSKLLKNDAVTSGNPPSLEHKAYSDIAVMLYRFNLQKIKWSSFLKAAINTASNECPWLTRELARCQQSYKAQPNDAVIIEQSAFFSGIFSEELAYIDALLGTDAKPE